MCLSDIERIEKFKREFGYQLTTEFDEISKKILDFLSRFYSEKEIDLAKIFKTEKKGRSGYSWSTQEIFLFQERELTIDSISTVIKPEPEFNIFTIIHENSHHFHHVVSGRKDRLVKEFLAIVDQRIISQDYPEITSRKQYRPSNISSLPLNIFKILLLARRSKDNNKKNYTEFKEKITDLEQIPEEEFSYDMIYHTACAANRIDLEKIGVVRNRITKMTDEEILAIDKK